ncbi:protein timeless-like [Tropilaelaps mercedesae]|uniref:Protein timeless-like n=1 Tax=Tropilaelaps mercedesae TaxID=418985 RepID=A0A1V9Y028_9ACAR|nr:protein timeless-like [Tropilaelaps mercedesae]
MDDWKTSLLLSDLQAACNSLGGWDENTYVKESDCTESLKDLLRYLRRDDESFAIRRALGQINVIKTDLLPLLRFYHKDAELFDITAKLVVNLTTPIVLLYKEELPIEKNARNIYMTLEATLCAYKDAFLEKEIWSVFAKRLEELMNLNYHERTEEDTETITRILTILRNVLHPIHREELNLKTDGDVSSHDRLLWALHLAGMDDLIIYMCASRMEQSHTLYVLEILRLMLREQEASFLASTGTQRLQEEVEKDGAELMKLREIERKKKDVEIKGIMQNRFARFSSTYQVRNIKSLGDDTRKIIVVGDPGKVLQSINNMDLDQKKKFRSRPKNRRPEESASIKRRTTRNIRLFLKEFCSDLLNSVFNALLPQARKAIARAGETGDEGHYFWLLDFFLEFNRLTGCNISLVSEAISKETFHFVQTQMEKCHELMVTDKKRIHLWVKRLHVGLKTFHQLLMTISVMIHDKVFQVREAAKVLQQHIFYLPEYRDMILHLLLNFNENAAPVSFLRDLAIAVHIYLRMLEVYCEKGKLRVKDIKQKAKCIPPAYVSLSEEELDQRWLELSKEITTLLDVESSQFSYDVDTVLSGYQQYEQAFQVQMCKQKIAEFLKLGETSSAIGLLRASRTHFPEEACFGEATITAESEFMFLRSLFYAENIVAINSDNEPNIEIEEVERMQDFDFENFLKRFANPKVIKVYGLLLSNYTTNSADVNKACVKMLHRIAFDLKMWAMLFQSQIFVVFDKILEDYSITPEVRGLKELARFAKYIIQQFVDVAKTNDLAIVELLFWKTSAEAYQIQYGYNETESTKKRPWTEEEELELKRLFEENNDDMELGEDIIEVIRKKFSNQSRTRRQIITHLRVMGLVEKGTCFKPSGISSNQVWSAEEEQELREHYQNFATSIDPLSQIMLHMTTKRPKFRIIEKLLELGVIHDRAEVRKRRVKKNGEIVIPRSIQTRMGKEINPTDINKEFVTSEDSSSEDEACHLDTKWAAEMTRENTEFIENITSDRSTSEIRHSNRQKKQIISKRSRKVTSKIEKSINPEDIKALLIEAVERRRPAIDWILESIQDALGEWKNSGNEAVPLVPLLEAEYDSLKDKNFCRLLSTFGFVPPQKGTEQYWRIGGELSRIMLQSRLDVLINATHGYFEKSIVNIEKKEIDVIEPLSPELSLSGSESPRGLDESSNDDGDVLSDDQTLYKSLSPQKPKKTKLKSHSKQKKKALKTSKKKRIRSLYLTEFAQEPKDLYGNGGSQSPNGLNESQERNKQTESSFDVDTELTLEDDNGNCNTQGAKRNFSTQRDGPEKSAKKRRIAAIDSASEDEADVNQQRKAPTFRAKAIYSKDQTLPRRNKKVIIESDESDE